MATQRATKDTFELEKLKKEIDALKRHLHVLSHHHDSLPLTISPLSLNSLNVQRTRPFYSHPCGHKLCLQTEVSQSKESLFGYSFAVYICLMEGEFDRELTWPIKARVTVQIQNQSSDSNHIKRSKQISWQFKSKGDPLPIPVMFDINAAILKGENGVKYVVKDTLQLEVMFMILDN